MRLRLALLSILFGVGFLAHAALDFFESASVSKIVPSLAQDLLGGFGVLWLQLLLFVAAFVALHGLAGWLFAALVAPATRRIAAAGQSDKLLLLLFLIAQSWLILHSAGRFPRSALGVELHGFATAGVGWWLKLGLATVTAAALLLGGGLHARRLAPRLRAASRRHVAAAAATALLVAALFAMRRPSGEPFPADPDRPHVIVVGIDGWRLDTLPHDGAEPARMPFVRGFLEDAAVIEEAYTPLARTFPSWWTILTGQYPAAHGARFNLIADSFIETGARLPAQLGKLGYTRVLAMDERRFASLREEHGFDRVVGPGLGAADFLLGSFNDAPLANALVNTRLGGWLFPFNHANRAADFTYRPETFDELVADAIGRLPRQPLLLAVHYELPHQPYTWARGPQELAAPHPPGKDYAAYRRALERVDAQVAQLFEHLEARRILDDAIVVLLSDHGEAFAGEDRAWHHRDTDERITTPVGHGTHVLGLAQHRVPLAFRRYGGEPVSAGVRPGRASLADVYPTIADWLRRPVSGDVDGRSLLPVLRGDLDRIPDRPIPLETGLVTDSVLRGLLDESRVFQDAAAYYRIPRDGSLELRPAETRRRIAEKQRAVLRGDRILAHLGRADRRFVAGSLDGGERLAYREIASADSAAPQLVGAFCAAFRADRDQLRGLFARHCDGGGPPAERAAQGGP